MITPEVVIRPMELPASSVNHMAPSGPAAMEATPEMLGSV